MSSFAKFTSTIYEELSSIRQIFDCVIVPDLTQINQILTSDQICIKLIFPNDFATSSSKRVKFDLHVKFTDLYPHDIPQLTVNNGENLQSEHVSEMATLSNSTVSFLSGKLMLTEVILKLQEYVHEKVYNNKPPTHRSRYRSRSSIESISEEPSTQQVSLCDYEGCVDYLLNKNHKLVFLSDIKSTSSEFQIVNCQMHHCGVCYCHGTQCDGSLSSYFFRVWRFSNSDPESYPKYRDVLKRAIFTVIDSVNLGVELNNKYLCLRNRAFFYSFSNSFYVFIGTPLSYNYSLPICQYIEGSSTQISQKTIQKFVIDMVKGLDFLHIRDITHGSLYPCNVLLTSGMSLKLRDFGSINELWSFWKTHENLPVETKKNVDLHHFETYSSISGGVSPANDIFHLGLIIISICGCKIYDRLPIQYEHFLYPKLSNFLSKCLKYIKSQRFNTSQLLKHIFIRENIIEEPKWYGMTPFFENMAYSSSSVMCEKNQDTRLVREFDLMRPIGKGGFGFVVLVRNKVDSCVYAVKRIMIDKRDANDYEEIVREVHFLSRLNHPNIVRYYNSWIDHETVDWFGVQESFVEEESTLSDSLINDNFFHTSFSSSSTSNTSKSSSEEIITPSGMFIYMQMEYCERDSLRRVIEQESLHLNKKRIWRLFRDICSGLDYIHKQGMIHRDIKPENILITTPDTAKIVDFNLATVVRNNSTEESKEQSSVSKVFRRISTSYSTVGTTPYIAPEVLNPLGSKSKPSSKIDMYSLGIMFFEMCHPPFQTNSEKYMFIDQLRLKQAIPESFDSNQISIIKGLVDIEPNKRFSAKDLLSTGLYPVSIEEVNLDWVLHHIKAEPFSEHSKKVLKCFFEHDSQEVDLSHYLSKFNDNPVDEKLNLFWASKCLILQMNQLIRQHGWVNLQLPLLYPCQSSLEFKRNPALCFANAQGTRLYFNTDVIGHVFNFIHSLSSEEVRMLPVAKFGGIWDSFMFDQPLGVDFYPKSFLTAYIGYLCTIENPLYCLAQCINECIKVVSFLLDTFKSSKDTPSRIKHDANSPRLGKFKGFSINISHLNLFRNLLGSFGVEPTDFTIFDNFFNVSHNFEYLKAQIEVLIAKYPRLALRRSFLYKILTFRDTIKSFHTFVRDNVFSHHYENAKPIIEHMQQFIIACSYILDQDLDIQIKPFLQLNQMWSSGEVVFEIVGTFKCGDTCQDIALVTGGLFTSPPKNNGVYVSSKGNCLENWDISTKKLAYCSISGNFLSKITEYIHLKKSCVYEPTPIVHDLIILCSESECSQDPEALIKLYKFADILRGNQYNLSVYVIDHQVSHDSIRDARKRLCAFNVVAVFCLKLEDVTVKVFFIEKDSFLEIHTKSLSEASLWVRKHLRKSAFLLDRNEKNPDSNRGFSSNSKDIVYIPIDINMKNCEKYLQNSCRQQLLSVRKLFNEFYKFVVFVVDFSVEELAKVTSELSYDFITNNATSFTHRELSPKTKVILSAFNANTSVKTSESVFFIFNTQTNKLKSLI